MSFDFILMLTANDRTIEDAPSRLEEALEGGVRHIGFKDVGLPLSDLKGLADTIRNAGGRSYLEVVSLDEESELASARAAVELDVDCLLGGTRANVVTDVTRDHPLRYYPFPGHILGHPSVLEGTEDEIINIERIGHSDRGGFLADRQVGGARMGIRDAVVLAGYFDLIQHCFK